LGCSYVSGQDDSSGLGEPSGATVSKHNAGAGGVGWSGK
jgi:hypothetical protein